MSAFLRSVKPKILREKGSDISVSLSLSSFFSSRCAKTLTWVGTLKRAILESESLGLPLWAALSFRKAWFHLNNHSGFKEPKIITVKTVGIKTIQNDM